MSETDYLLIFTQVKSMLTNNVNVYQIFSYLKDKKINIHQLLTSVDPNELTQRTIYTLINEGILNIQQYHPVYGGCRNFENYMSNIDDSLLLNITNRIELEHSEYYTNKNINYKIDRIQRLRSRYELINYIYQNFEDIYLALLWSSWECFDCSDIELYIKCGTVNPFKIRPEFDTSDVQNINYLQHLELLEKEYKSNSVYSLYKYYELKKLISFIKNIKNN